MNIKGKVVVVSGAGSGIGKASAHAFAQRGADVAITDIDKDRIHDTAEELRGKYSVKVDAQVLDVTDWAAWQHYRNDIISKFGQVDIVLNNAGVTLGPFSVEEVPMEKFEWVMNINFWGMVYGTKAFLPDLKARPEACVANISSILGLGAIGSQAPYCSSKFAIRGFNESLRMEALAEFPQLNVLSIHPGGIQTRIARDADWGGLDFNEEEKLERAKKFEESFINTPKYAAEQILAAVEKDKKRLLIGKDAKSMWRMIKWFPIGYTKMFYKQIVKDLDI